MATEVTCGQCHGRLLIETPGVVVACPHCGVHLSIPAPAAPPVAVAESAAFTPEPTTPPESLSIPQPTLERDTDIDTPPASGTCSADQTNRDPGDMEFNFGQMPDPLPEFETQVAGVSQSNIFDGTDEAAPEDAAQLGWHSAPNLSLGTAEPVPAAVAEAQAAPAGLFTAPLMEPDSGSSSAADQTVAMFAEFAEAPSAVEPTVTFAVAEAVAPADGDAMNFLSASQQFTLDQPDDAVANENTQPMFSFAEPPRTETPTITLPGAPAADDLVLSSSQQFSLGTAAAAVAAVPTGQTSAQNISPAPASPGTNLPSSAKSMSATVSGFADAEAASRQKFLFFLLLVIGSYASAVTIALIYVLAFGRTHQLESLPDVKPPMKKGEIAVTFYSPKNELPRGHVLKLGESQRFGNVRVTPVKVTRGPVRFEHYSNQNNFKRDDTQPVLKLWLKFENASRDQTFSPLDSLLVFKRTTQNLGEKVFANNFLGTVEDRKLARSLFYVYDLPVHSEFSLVGQKLDTELSPGDTWQTFVPSEESAVELKGDLVWRVHIRKGHHPKSLRGVTTLIDVVFNSSDITEDRETT